jgi:hypothetical protein
VAAALLAILLIDEIAEHRVVELDAVGPRGQHVDPFLHQHRLGGMEEVLAGGVSAGRVLRRPEPPQKDVGAGQADLDHAVGVPAEEGGAVGDDGPLPLQRGHGSGPEAGAPLDQVGLEASDALVENLEIALAPPLAVAENVDPCRLL